MKWLDRLERKLGRYAVGNLMIYIVASNLLVYLLQFVDKTGLLYSKLTLVPQMVLQGEVWRLITFIAIPPSTNILFILFTLYFYYLIGSSLEHEWSSFKFNIYYFSGMFFTAAASMLTGEITTGLYLNTSLLLAFARIYPDYPIQLFFFVPIKVKYLAWLDWAFIAFTVLVMPVPVKIIAAASVLNYLIFFGKDIVTNSKKRGSSLYRKQVFNAKIPKNITIHRCHICGITEKEAPKMDFRYCMQCEGDYEYCEKHLNNHEHVKKAPT